MIRHFVLTNAQASQLVGIVTPLLQARAAELLRGKKIRGRSQPVTVTPELRGNRLVIAAPIALMEEALLKELQRPQRRCFPNKDRL